MHAFTQDALDTHNSGEKEGLKCIFRASKLDFPYG